MEFHFKRLLYSRVGKIIISLLLGLGLATLFRKVCNKKKLFSISSSTFE